MLLNCRIATYVGDCCLFLKLAWTTLKCKQSEKRSRDPLESDFARLGFTSAFLSQVHSTLDSQFLFPSSGRNSRHHGHSACTCDVSRSTVTLETSGTEGGAQVYILEDGTWIEQDHLFIPETETTGILGRSIDLDGDSVVVSEEGTLGNRGNGAANNQVRDRVLTLSCGN